jgi:predicted nucleic acid-binding protein
LYLLDTDVVIYHLNGVSQMRAFLRRLMASPVYISSVTVMEVEEGIPLGSDPAAAMRLWLRLRGRILLLAFDEAEALRAADIRRNLRSQGRSVRGRPLDLMIAATAIEHGLTLATNNPGDFRDIPKLLIATP